MTATSSAPARRAVPSPRSAADADAGAVESMPKLRVPETQQWLSTSLSREVADGYSWMQAVHWVAGSGLYEPQRSDGPRFGATTVQVAQLLAALSPCRPGVAYLRRRTGLSKRTVQYHLGMLREAGLLAYISKGTRERGQRPQASEFARMIPPAFDSALGIRIDGEGTGRRMIGIADTGRSLMARLGKLAARKRHKNLRTVRPRMTPTRAGRAAADGASETAGTAGSRCTPMQGGSGTGSGAGVTGFPPEAKLDSGNRESAPRTTPTPQRSRRPKLNRTGRRHQLARQLIEQVPWLGRCDRRRVSWVIQDLSDAGWDAEEVQAWLHIRGEVPATIHRPVGLLEALLRDALDLLPTREARAKAVEAWRDSRAAARRRHQEWDGTWQAPRSLHVRRYVTEQLTRVFAPKTGSTPDAAGAAREADVPEPATEAAAGVICVADLDPDEVRLARQDAQQQMELAGDPSAVTGVIEGLGRAVAEELFGKRLVRRALQLEQVARSSRIRVGSR